MMALSLQNSQLTYAGLKKEIARLKDILKDDEINHKDWVKKKSAAAEDLCEIMKLLISSLLDNFEEEEDVFRPTTDCV